MSPSRARALLDRLEARGVRLWLDEQARLRFRAPKGALTSGLRAEIGALKPALITLLSGPSDASQDGASGPIRRGAGDVAPVSFAQRRLWFLSQLEGGGGVYNMPAAWRLRGQLDVERLRAALRGLETRHAMLRTTFALIDGEPHQRVGPPRVELRVVDLGEQPPADRARAVARITGEAAQRAFDLGAGPLWAPILLRLGPTDHIFCLTLHHIIADGWSLSVLLAELVRLYARPAEALPALPVRYADFAVWQRAWLEGPEPAEQLRWWTAHLADAPGLLELPTDHPRPPVQRDRGAHRAFTLPARLGADLEALARSHRATLFMVLETAFAVLLSRYSGQTDVLVGTPVANRQHTAVEPLVGLFLNALVIRNDLAGAPTFAEALDRTRAVALDAFERQALPFEMLVEALRPQRSLAHSPVFQVMFNLINTATDQWALPGVSVEPFDVDYPVAKHDVILTMQSRDGILHGLFEYNTDLFEPATIERMVGHYHTLLDAIVADPERPVTTLPLLTEGERRRTLVEWNSHTAPRPDVPWHVLFTRQVARTPDAPAIVDRRGGALRTLTYREVHRRAHRLAVRLRKAGVGVDSVVGVSLPRSAETLVAMVAIFAAGGAYMPLEPTLPTARLADMAARAEAAAIIARPADHGRFDGFDVIEPFEVDVIRYDSHAISDDMNGAPGDAMGRLAYVLFTSGSTGRPKAAMVEQRGLINNLYAKIEDHEMGPETRLAQTAPVSFDISVWQFLAAPLVGGAVRVFEDDVARDPARFVERVEAEGITHVEVVPSFFRFVLDALDAPDAPRLKGLRWVSLTGEALPPALLGPWFARFPDVPILNAYGPAECSDDATHHVLRGPLPAGTAAVPIGRAIPNARLYVLDGARQPVPIGVPGELYVGGVGVGRGYLGDPAQTAERFVDDPFDPTPGARMYRTGDGVRALADGTLVFLGRLDHQVKLRGVRIELGEIEATLAAHPTVHEALAEVRDVDGEQHLVAWLSLADGAGADAAARAEARIEQWSDLHDESHRAVRLLDDDPTLDVHGWDSMYDNRPLPAASMHQYIGGAVERALAGAPRRILEIGCGTGLLAFRLIPRVERYLGIDISPVIVDALRVRCAEPAVRARVANLDAARFETGRADDLAHLPAGAFDLVMLPSMVQYLPSGDHLAAVIEGLVGKVADGGSILVGDVRHRGLLPAFHGSLQASRAPADDRDALRERALRSLHAEPELAVDPRFFTRLAARIPRITHVEVLPERGPLHDEMTRFRYDVRLHVGGPEPATPEVEWLDWQGQRLDALEAMLADRAHLGLRRVANARLTAALGDLHRLGLTTEPPPDGALEPAELWALGRRTGHRALVSLAAGYADGAFDVLFTRAEGPIHLPADDARGTARLTTDPTLRARADALEGDWRRSLAERLPSYMVPAHIVALAELPLTPNGKVDRRWLPPPAPRVAAVADDRPPTATEATLLDIWREVLPVDAVGLHSDFFDSGGHSLLATVLVSRVRKALDVELPLRQVFDTPTVAGLARAVEASTAKSDALQPLVAGPRPATLPLSFAQQRLWFLTELQGPSAQYSLPNGLRLRGSLDPERVEAAFAAIEAHHEALRATVHTVDGQAALRIGPPRFRLHRHDLSRRTAAEREAALAQLVAAESGRVFDLATGPLWRVTLVRLADEAHALLVVMHHIISDGWSMGVLGEAFGALYRDPGAALPPLPVQYPDYALWQRRQLEGEIRQRLLDHWTDRLDGAPTLSIPPADHPRPAQQTDAGDRLVRALDPAVVARLAQRARAHDATLFMALEALFAVLIGRCAGQDDVCIGTPIAGRRVAEVEGLIGLFVNTLVLRNDLSGDPSFAELLGRVREAALAAYAHQALPFEALVDGLALERSLAHSPLFQALFALQNEPRRPLDLPGLTIEVIETPPTTARFDLSLIVLPLGDGWRAEWSWRTALYDRSTIERLADGFDRLLAAAAEAPGTPIGRLPLLAESDRRRALDLWSGAAQARPAPDDTVLHRFFARAARTPDAPAAIDGDRCLDHRALAARAERLAGRLHRRGVGPDAVVGLHLERSVDMIVGLLGIMRAGGAYLPLDPSLPAERLAAMLTDAGARAIVTDGPVPHGVHGMDVIDIDGSDESSNGIHDLPPMPSPSHLAYVIFTSGSTGRPKGVAVEHGNLMAYVDGVVPAIGLRPGATFATVSTLAADLGNTAIFPALCTGGAVLVPDGDAITDPERFARLARRRGMHGLKITPTHMTALLSGSDPAGVVPTELLVLGGEACDRALIETVRRLRPGCRVVNHYGPTETTIGVLTHRIDDRSDRPIPLGRPLPGAVVHVLDRHGQPVPLGVPGELCVAGAQVTRGYIGRPELTAERFVDGPDGRRMYRTGDRCRWVPGPDGGPPRVEFLGRVDAQVKIRGFRVEPGEVEACLARLPGVEAAAVIVDRGAGGARLIAHVVGEGARDVAAVRAGLGARLPDYMVPARIVWRPSLPRNANGKIDRRVLAAEPLPASAATERRLAPRTATEATLVEIWRAVLGLDAVGVTDDFFHIGGDSIVSIRIVSRVRAAGLALDARQIFEHRTIAELARHAERASDAAVERARRVGPVTLLAGQRRFVELGWQNPDHYNVPLRIRLVPGIEVSALQAALQAVVEAHDVFRLRLGADGQAALVPDAPAVPLVVVELTSADDPTRRAATAEAHAGLSITDGPLGRAVLFRIADRDEDELLWVLHHLAVDGFSCRILLDDLSLALTRVAGGDAPRLPSVPCPFGAWADRVAARYPAPAAGPGPRAPVPLDHTTGPDDNRSQARISRRLDRATTRALLRAPARAGARVDSALLTALALAWRGWTGRGDLRVELESHGRGVGDVDLSRTVGWLAGGFAFDLALPPLGGPAEALRAIDARRRAVGEDASLFGVAQPAPAVHFNYIGQFAAVDDDGPLRGLVDQDDGLPAESPDGQRLWLLDVNAAVIDGRLDVHWFFGRNRHRRETIEALADGWVDALSRLLEGLAPGPEARVEDDVVEDRYPLSPSQAGMLVETLAAPGSARHVEQSIFTWRGPLDRDAFTSAWRAVQARHPVLRTGFDWADGQPTQYVMRDAPVSIEWQAIAADDGTSIDRRAAAERKRGFDPSSAPLFRLAVFDEDAMTHHVIWTRHHILTDGWSFPIIVGELMALYRARLAGRTAELPPARPYRAYIDWLAARDRRESEGFWRGVLRGFETPTPIGRATAGDPASDGDAAGYGYVDRALDVDGSAALAAAARGAGLTPNTLARAAWARVLARHGETRDVVFGATVSGRPPDLDGVESMVGVFINTVPVRVDAEADAPLGAWLAALQRQAMAAEPHGWCAAGEIQGWSPVSRGQALYDSVLVFENYPVGAGPAEADIALVGGRSVGAHTRHALTALVMPGETLRLRLVHDRARIDAATAGALIDRFAALIRALAEGLARDDTRPLAEVIAVAERVPLPRAAHRGDPGRSAGPVESAGIPPRTPTERALAVIWQAALGAPIPSVESDLFDLGGHSLVALRLIARIEQRLGVRLGFADILQNPTIERLAARIETPGAGAAQSAVVTLNAAGSRRPLFCLPGGGGNVVYLHALARLSNDRPVHALQAVGLEGEAPPHETVEAAAKRYVADMRAVQPAGPYLLAGHSFGGRVAFEMARQLRADGVAVERLVLFDSTVPTPRADAPIDDWSDDRWALALVETFAAMYGHALGPIADRLLGRDGPALERALRDALVELTLLPPGADPRFARGWLAVFRADMRSRYAPSPGLDVPVTLMRATEWLARDARLTGDVDDMRHTRTLGWDRLVHDIEVIDVPGDHITMMASPHVQVLAERLVACLERES